MACSRCGKPTPGPICAVCKGELPQRAIAVRGRGSILPVKEGYHGEGNFYSPNTKLFSDGGNDEIYEEILALKSALEAIGDRIKLLKPHPPLELMVECKFLAIKLETEVERRRGR